MQGQPQLVRIVDATVHLDADEFEACSSVRSAYDVWVALERELQLAVQGLVDDDLTVPNFLRDGTFVAADVVDGDDRPIIGVEVEHWARKHIVTFGRSG